jgi:hypothetical protein
VRDWWKSGVITEQQHDRMAADLDTGLRRTNVFLRATLCVFGLLITLAATGLVAVIVEPGQSASWILAALAAAASFVLAMWLVNAFHLYRFGIEEALAVASVFLAGAAVILLLEPMSSISGSTAIGFGFVGAAIVAFIVFFEFGFVYAAVLATACAALAPFELVESDVARRLIAVAVLAALFLGARLQRGEHGEEFPGDAYAVMEAAAWSGVYLLLNLKISSWVSHTAEAGWFYWATYAATWMLPAAGLWIAIREKHRLLLDVNIALALVTLMTNKAYLNASRNAWDPIAFGVLLIAIALGVRRWLASGADQSRDGFVPVRVLASERERLAVAGNVSVLQPSLHPQHPAAPPEPTVGHGGQSGGGGAKGSY